MNRNFFGDPIPFGSAEIEDAIEEKEMGEDLFALIEFNEYDGGMFDGFTAEIHDNEDSELSFTTKGYDSKEELISDLRVARIYDVQYL